MARRDRDRELDEEIQAHLRIEAEQRIESGQAPEEAWAAATRDFGNVALIKEATREVWGFACVERLRQDVQYGLRGMRRQPAFGAVAVLSLALGIGANTAVFTMLDAVLWKPLPVQDPEGLVQIRTLDSSSGRLRGVPSALLPGLQQDSEAFSGVVAAVSDGIALRFEGQTERVLGEAVTANYFSVLGVPPFLGRYFAEGADRASWEPVAVLSYDFFRRRFGTDPTVIGRTVHLNGDAFTVIGVSPPGFFGLEVGRSPEVRLPMMLEPGMQRARLPAMSLVDPRNEGFVTPTARLRPGLTREQVEAAAEVAYQQLQAAHPDPNAVARHVRLFDGRSEVRGYGRPLAIVMSLAGLVLLISCANIATLLLARGAARQHEMGIRLAVGAGRGRLVRQLLTESVLIAAAGGAVGVVLARGGTAALSALLGLGQGSVPMVLDLRPDARMLAFAAAVSIAATLLFGLVPALHATRLDPLASLRPQPSGTGPRGRLRLGRGMVAAQVALALVLVAGAGLFARSLRNLDVPSLGYDADRVVLISMKHVQDGRVRYTAAQLQAFFPELVRRVASLPGVTGAAVSGSSEGAAVPGVRKSGRTLSVERDDGTVATVELLFQEAVSPSFFGTFGIATLAGRSFTDADTATAPRAVVVSEALARDLFGNANPLGHRIRPRASLDIRPHVAKAEAFSGVEGSGPADWEIVGVVSSAPYATAHRPASRVCFFPLAQVGTPIIATLLVRTTLPDVGGLVTAVRREIQALDPELPLFNVRTAASQMARERTSERLVTSLSSVFGSLALLLAGIGLYGVVAYAITHRVREVGIRMALGAARGSVAWMVVRDSLALVLAGSALGLPAAYAAGRLVASELHGVPPHDPVVAAGSLLLMIVVAAASAWLPARRASRIDPAVALRAE